tara:strand:- start:67 stop:426 length:360 start_codon:yes stop_codon:yes gene_type:complete
MTDIELIKKQAFDDGFKKGFEANVSSKLIKDLQDDANFWEMKCREIWSKAGGMNPMNKDYKNFLPGEQFSWEGDRTSSPCSVEIVEVFDVDTIKVTLLDDDGTYLLSERYVHPSELKPV